jgi:hypothetical protein
MLAGHTTGPGDLATGVNQRILVTAVGVTVLTVVVAWMVAWLRTGTLGELAEDLARQGNPEKEINELVEQLVTHGVDDRGQLDALLAPRWDNWRPLLFPRARTAARERRRDSLQLTTQQLSMLRAVAPPGPTGHRQD